MGGEKKKLLGSTVKQRLGKLRAAKYTATRRYERGLDELQARCSHDRAYTYCGMEYSDGGWSCPDCDLERYRAPKGWESRKKEGETNG